MRVNSKVQIGNGWSACIGAVCAMVAGSSCLMLLTSLVLNERIGEKSAARMIYFVLLICGLICGIAGRPSNRKTEWVVSIGAAAIFTCILLIAGMLFFEGPVAVPLIPILMIAIGNGLACAIKINKHQKNTGRKKRRR